jgi:hypothetical protein
MEGAARNGGDELPPDINVGRVSAVPSEGGMSRIGKVLGERLIAFVRSRLQVKPREELQ